LDEIARHREERSIAAMPHDRIDVAEERFGRGDPLRLGKLARAIGGLRIKAVNLRGVED
jgi:hypothetical protein